MQVADGLLPAPILDEIQRLAERLSIPIKRAHRAGLDELARGIAHQGVVLLVDDFRYAPFHALARLTRVILLDGVTDPVNLGSIARSAEAFGWDGILIPRHRTARVTAAAMKVSSGALMRIEVAQVGGAAGTINLLKEVGFFVCGLDPSFTANYREVEPELPICLVVGAEGRGLSRLARERCDTLVQIPMSGAQASINVAVAAAVYMAQHRAPITV